MINSKENITEYPLESLSNEVKLEILNSTPGDYIKSIGKYFITVIEDTVIFSDYIQGLRNQYVICEGDLYVFEI